MRKSTIWLLAIVMAFAFIGLLYLQIQYVSTILKTRNEQFNETVRRSLNQVVKRLEMDEARQYLDEDIQKDFLFNSEENELSSSQNLKSDLPVQIDSSDPSLYANRYKKQLETPVPLTKSDNIVTTLKKKQEMWLDRYRYQEGLLKAVLREIVLSLIDAPNLKPIQDRIDFKKLNFYLGQEFASNGLNIPYIFSVVNKDGNVVYQSGNIKKSNAADVIVYPLFPSDPPSKMNFLRIYFPTKKSYIFRSVEFIIPSVIFTLVLLVTFTFTIFIVFRQKKLSEMKNDFINNMTHELKTPVSTISLAAQMLKDSDITKSPQVFKHISGVINDETKRLSFLVEKVLQMSLFERQKATLKLKEVDANDLLANIAHTFKLKVEKYGGEIDIDLQAADSTIYVDEMHFTNVLFNLMDNAVKYRRPDIPLKLMARTWNENGKLMLSIEDNGVGIKKEYLKKVFDRFFRVPTGNVHDVKGFGLGLAYVRKIIEDLSGSIRAESELNNGTKFIISLPLIKS
ncbi:sensor histidine kinase [Parabacteroides pacaensis]|uniref:sensor histidine kinase n=1 Tax=Parabacteroides pacaensis TaxID=2086575 RepID=UPI000D1039A8|nr:HAMP domain-containing sensor histidine kinase [Parabacteroides pacaensis]